MQDQACGVGGGAAWSSLPTWAGWVMMAIQVVGCSKAGESALASADAGTPVVTRSPALSVLSHHNSTKRSGTYIQSGLTAATVPKLHKDVTFGGQFQGLIHAQPLYVKDGVNGNGTFYVVTESNDVHAFDDDGALLWTRSLGTPSDNESAACISKFTPIGVTGTPTIDPASRTLYVGSALGAGAPGARMTSAQLVHAVSLDDGTERAGWPVDTTGLTSNGHAFDPGVQNQRGGRWSWPPACSTCLMGA